MNTISSNNVMWKPFPPAITLAILFVICLRNSSKYLQYWCKLPLWSNFDHCSPKFSCGQIYNAITQSWHANDFMMIKNIGNKIVIAWKFNQLMLECHAYKKISRLLNETTQVQIHDINHLKNMQVVRKLCPSETVKQTITKLNAGNLQLQRQWRKEAESMHMLLEF